MNQAEATGVGRFAAVLLRQAAWPAALVGVGTLVAAAPEAASGRGWLAFVLTALAGSAALGLSVLLAFDALLFRLLASHGSESAGGAAVDDLLARTGLKARPDRTRTLAERMAGTRRLLTMQRLSLAIFSAAMLAGLLPREY